MSTKHEDPVCTPPGYRLQPMAEFDAMQNIAREHADMAILLRRLAFALNKADPENKLAGTALRYLDRIGERGNILRGETPTSLGELSGQKPVAWVPVHPRNGPLWGMTTDSPDPERLPGYPLKKLFIEPEGESTTPA